MIVANRVGDDCGFDHDENAADVFWGDGEQSFQQTTKTELAEGIIRLVAERYELTTGEDTEPRLSIISSRKIKS